MTYRRTPEMIVQTLYNEIRFELTPSGRRMLRLLLTRDRGDGLTRQQIAQFMDKPRLCRYDINLLKQLEDRGYVLSERQSALTYEQRLFCREMGKSAPPTWNYLYRVNPRLRPYFDEISARSKKGRSDSRPLLVRLKDLIS